MKVESDGTGKKVESDGTGKSVESDGTGKKIICRVIKLPKENYFL